MHREITAEGIADYSSGLKAEDVLVSSFCLNYGRKDRNPVENVYFYNSSSVCIHPIKEVGPFHISVSQTSLILPELFQERYVRVFAKRQEDVTLF